MAFVRKTGKKFEVRKGDNNQLLSSFDSAEEAKKEVERLHSKNKPGSENKGKSAKTNFFSGNKPRDETLAMKRRMVKRPKEDS
jgi:hypothetical protein